MVGAEMDEYQKYYPDALKYSFFENREQKERLSKFIANSAGVYNFFGFEHRLPFYDLTLLEFFRNLPYRYKLNRQLYNNLLREKFFKPFGVDIKTPVLQPSRLKISWQRIKEKIKLILPGYINKLFYSRRDDYFYRDITRSMKEDMKTCNYPFISNVRDGNEIIVQWYLFKVFSEKNKKS
jgi:asparagine synthase (glutamine-hydrolysing)